MHVMVDPKSLYPFLSILNTEEDVPDKVSVKPSTLLAFPVNLTSFFECPDVVNVILDMTLNEFNMTL